MSLRRDDLHALAWAAGAATAFDLLFSAAKLPRLPLAYFALTVAGVAAAALLTASLCALAPRRLAAGGRLALAAWLALQAGLVAGAVPGLALGAAGFLLLRAAGAADPRRDGLAVAFATATAFVAWPRLAVALPGSDLASAPSVAAAVCLAVLAAMQGTDRASRALARAIPLGREHPGLAPLSSGIVLLVALVALQPPPEASGDPALPAVAAPPPSVATPSGRERPHLIVLVLDTVRADRLGIYGYRRDTTPALAGFLARSPRARRYPLAFAPGSWTVPSHVSLLTGRLPSEHGAHGGRFPVAAAGAWPEFHAERTLAETLRAAGYRTGAVLANELLGLVPGIERGFDRFARLGFPRLPKLAGEGLRRALAPHAFAHAVKPQAPAARVNAAALAFLDGCGERPCFLLANYMDAHAPYAAPPGQAGRWRRRAPGAALRTPRRGDSPALLAAQADRYDEALRGLDAELGGLLAELEARGLLDRSWLVITADHGESFGEHAHFGHGTSVSNEQVRVPLVIQPPRGVRLPPRDGAVGLLDVTATLARAATGAALGRGQDLAAPEGPPHAVVIEQQPGLAEPGEPVARALVLGRRKLVERDGRRELYDLDDDLREQRGRGGAAADALAARLPAPAGPAPPLPAARVPLAPERRAALRALGYLAD